MKTAFVADDFLIIKTGDGYYDINKAFEVKNVKELIEMVGVRGGHVGWQLKVDPNYSDYGFDFGRKYRNTMEEVKDLINEGKIKAKVTILNDCEQRCF